MGSPAFEKEINDVHGREYIWQRVSGVREFYSVCEFRRRDRVGPTW